MTAGNGHAPDFFGDAPTSLEALAREAIAGLDDVTSDEERGRVLYSRDGRPFAGLEAGALLVCLPSVVTRAALRTPHTAPSDRGPDWLRFAPLELDRFAIDRAVAWIKSAWRHAAD